MVKERHAAPRLEFLDIFTIYSRLGVSVDKNHMRLCTKANMIIKEMIFIYSAAFVRNKMADVADQLFVAAVHALPTYCMCPPTKFVRLC